MKSIHTLIPDIYKLVQTKGWFTDELADEFARTVSTRVQQQFSERHGKASLRLSQMAPRCPKALWHSIHTPELAEAMPPWAEIKYSYGHMIEALAIVMTKAAGHTVEGEQDEIVLDGIVGHRDCVIDGCLVDVKSLSSRSFEKLKDKSFEKMDSFGYLAQLDGYVVGSELDDLVKVKDKGYIFGVDKTLGKLVLYEHRIRPEEIRNRIADYKSVVQRSIPPACTCGTRPSGASGNVQLDTRASYNPFKQCCFPLLRTFLYANGPVFLTKVNRVPDVPEVTRKRVDTPHEMNYN